MADKEKPPEALNPSDWEDLGLVKKDICFLYHELADYRHFMPDLNYGYHYQIEYWKFLGVLDIFPEDGGEWPFWPKEGHIWPGDELLFIKQGCMMLILAMCLDTLEGSGDNISADLEAICTAVEKCTADDARTEKLLHALRLALQLVRTNGASAAISAELNELAYWAHQEFVGGYFRSLASHFNAD